MKGESTAEITEWRQKRLRQLLLNESLQVVFAMVSQKCSDGITEMINRYLATF